MPGFHDALVEHQVTTAVQDDLAGGSALFVKSAGLTRPAVTSARSEVDVIVTEFGAAELRGQTLAERARRMVAIAHPDFREELDRAAFEIRQRGF